MDLFSCDCLKRSISTIAKSKLGSDHHVVGLSIGEALYACSLDSEAPQNRRGVDPRPTPILW
jgi:hypothetical protein